MNSIVKNHPEENALSITSELNAPVERVWEAWTDPSQLEQWWGPAGFTTSVHKMEVKTGGEWNLVMHGPDGTDYINHIIYKEVVKHKKLLFEYRTTPKHVTTVEFTPKGDKTMLYWHMTFENREQFDELIQKVGVDEKMEENVLKLIRFLAEY
jgi:uncharacterized protein YndB with AHSA1/START domain